MGRDSLRSKRKRECCWGYTLRLLHRPEQHLRKARRGSLKLRLTSLLSSHRQVARTLLARIGSSVSPENRIERPKALCRQYSVKPIWMRRNALSIVSFAVMLFHFADQGQSGNVDGLGGRLNRVLHIPPKLRLVNFPGLQKFFAIRKPIRVPDRLLS